MSTTAAEATTTTAPIANVPVTDVTASTAAINVEDHSTINNATTAAAPTTTTTTTVANPNVKVTPIQRINSLYNKAKLSFNEVLTDAHKAVNEKNTTTTSTAAATETATATEANPSVPQNAHAEPKVGGPNSFRDIINRVKGLKTTSSAHPVAASEGQHTVFAATETGHVDTTGEGVPSPPPKDNVKPTTHATTSNGSPVVDQLKRNATLLATYILQKKKEFTENKAPENNGQSTSTTTPEVHDETANATAPNTEHTTTTGTNTVKPASTPLVRRITQLVHNATANINKKRETKKTSGTPVVVSEEAAPQPAAAAATEETPVVVASTTNHTTIA